METTDSITRINGMHRTQLGDSDFKRLAAFITSELGIKMPEIKKTMLQSRLQKRLHEIQMYSFKEYLDFVFSNEGLSERVVMMDIVTTNKTDFFRESAHFDFLAEKYLPEYMADLKRPVLKVWSAGCSSGEEPYTLAIVLSEFREKNKDFDFQITATDISTRVLHKAATAIYAEERVAPVSDHLKRKYLLRNKNGQTRTVRIVPELRSKVSFDQVNFMDDEYPVNGLFDVIFCRNVLIYFDRKTQEDVINKLCTKLKPGGHFFLGHSESITNFRVPLKQVKSTVYIKQE
jgi:chemotaxis protein methyltransferase CheR